MRMERTEINQIEEGEVDLARRDEVAVPVCFKRRR